jgi:hypothetical protein
MYRKCGFAALASNFLSFSFIAPQRRSLQHQVSMLSEEVRRLELELDEARERGDSAMLQARKSRRAIATMALQHAC